MVAQLNGIQANAAHKRTGRRSKEEQEEGGAAGRTSEDLGHYSASTVAVTQSASNEIEVYRHR